MIATYRLQLQPDFGFSEVEALIPYLERLGISHLYLSPITESRRGSTHGYDVVDHNAVREEIGGRAGFESVVECARKHGMEVIIDFVPNHAGVGPRNAYWQDMLAYGPHSPFGPFFDVDWNPIKRELRNKILLPFLGRPYGEVLDDGEITLEYLDGCIYAAYYEDRYRLNPATYAPILAALMTAAERTEPYWDMKDLLAAFSTLKRRERDKAETLRKRLVRLFERIDPSEVLHEFTGERLHEVLERQFWRLSYWKTAGSEINYRRFFDINGLVALRMEDDQVFWDVHQLLAELLETEGVAGVRIDHVDGLFDPHDYLERLCNAGGRNIWVEKILASGETLPEDWPVSGTTGYEFMNDVMGVLLPTEGRIPLEKTCRRIVGPYPSFQDEAYASKKAVIESSLSSELFRLAYELDRISEADYHTRDFTLEAIRQALAELVSVFDRYRTYLPHDLESAREVIQHAVYRARARNPVAERTVYDFVARVILGDVRDDLKRVQSAWVGRFQQYTAPVTAKGIEDTAFYRFVPFVALNEVGGEPDHFGRSLHAFHSRARYRAHRYPRSLLATATHDHKRGEDTRMRLIALAELADLWDETARELIEIGRAYTSEAGPSLTDQFLFIQVLAALWHDGEDLSERLPPYMLKASRESKQLTSWTNPDATYEEALEHFVLGMLADEGTGKALEELAPRLARIGYLNSISQLVIKMTTPGVPDVYQGTELLDLSLVDPDNRRPVDYAGRMRLLDELEPLIESPDVAQLQEMVDHADERFKLFATTVLLRLRGRERSLMDGEYLPLETNGSEHWIAYGREAGERAVIAVIPRFFASWPAHRAVEIGLPDALRNQSWTEALSHHRLEFDDVLLTSALPLPWSVLVSN